MKVLFYNSLPFFLAHGGTQTLLEALMRELLKLGVDVEPVKWWSDEQQGDVIHFMNRPSHEMIQLAKRKGFKLLMTENLDQTASRTASQLLVQRTFIKAAQSLLPKTLTVRMNWDAYQELDAMVYVVSHEWEAAQYLFGARSDRGYIIPHGMESEALDQLAQPQAEQDYLICAATIHPRKNSVLLAQAARLAGTPIVFLGKAYSEDDSYFKEFKSLVDGQIVRYPGFVSTDEKYRLLRGARGFAMMSLQESGSISVYEAAAARLPLFLTDLPWASKVYGSLPGTTLAKLCSAEKLAPALKAFYSKAHRQSEVTFPLLTWRDVAAKYLDIYHRLLST